MKSNITIRKAEIGDLPGILEIEYSCFAEDSFTKRQFTYLITRGKGLFLVVEKEDKIIAYLSLSFHSRTHNLRIYSIAVHPEYRHLKSGQYLMDETLEYARTHNVRKITLEVKVTNYPAIGLYKKYGFEATHILCGYYHDGADAYSMQLLLPACPGN